MRHNKTHTKFIKSENFCFITTKEAWMENKILPSSSGGDDIDSCGTHLGQRISRPAELPEFSWPPESRLKENGPLLFTTEENTRESTVNQSKSAKMVALGDCFQLDQFTNQNSVEGYTSNRKAQENKVESISHYPLCIQLQSTQHQHPHWISDVPTGETPESPNWVSKKSNILAQADTGRSSPKSDNSYTGKTQFHPYHGDLISGNPVVTSWMPLEMHNVSTGVVRDVGAVEQISSQHHTSCASSHGRGCPEEANRFGYSYVLEQSLLCSNRTGSNNPSYGDILSGGSASTGQMAGGKSLHDEAQKFIVSYDNRVDNLLESRGRSHMEGDMKEDLKAIDKENIKSSSTDDLSSKHGHSPSNCLQHVKSNKSNDSSLGLDGKSKLPSFKMSPAAEKLWDGSLQLNAYVTVSVVAFFKSGEKLLDLKWPEFVEVKGKVRLDAFEKYVGDLPRSRTRGLMVVSICFKEGTSEKGLKGMKEVARGYLKGERVGLANLSPGVDIYLCPRSNAIITILAKSGFFKGTTAVEGNSELMIGCVVWRKNATALTSVLKKPEEKSSSLREQLQKSPSDSSMLQGGGQGSLSVPSVENSNPSAPLSAFSNLEQANVTDKSVGINSSSRTTLTAPGVKLPPFQQKESELSSSHLWGFKGHLSSSEISYAHQSNDGPPKESTNLPKPVISLLPNASKRKMAFSDDDDLPEFDFGIGSGRSSSSHHSDGPILGNTLQLSGSRILDVSKQPTRPVAPSVFMSIPRSVISVSKEMPLARNVNDHSQLVSASWKMEQRHNSQSQMVPFDSSSRKNLFCDDDMPEWLPPPKTLPHESSNSTARALPPLPTGSVFPYPSPATTYNSFSSQPFPLYNLPANSEVPPPMPSQICPSYLTGFTFNPVQSPQSSSRASASSLQPADKRVRRS